MKLRREATDRLSVRLPGRGASPASRPNPPRRPVGLPRPARHRGPLCDGSSLRSRRRPAPGRRSGQLGRRTPPIGLTLRGMNGMRRRPAWQPGFLAVSLLSVVALLALLCFPVLAQATDSSELQYRPQIPSATGEHPPAHQKQPSAKSSNSGGAPAPPSTTSPGASGEESANKVSSSTGGAEPPAGQANRQGNPGSGNNGKERAPTQPSNQATPASHKSEGGGSSPLVPILIAIAVLAAASLGAVIYRQRRQRGPSSSVSPEAN
jgi:hypothetical protein